MADERPTWVAAATRRWLRQDKSTKQQRNEYGMLPVCADAQDNDVNCYNHL
jgi:hypothetical protein